MCFSVQPNFKEIAQNKVEQYRIQKPHQKEPYIYELAIMVADISPKNRSHVIHEIMQITR
jgi:hypothetical protein